MGYNPLLSLFTLLFRFSWEVLQVGPSAFQHTSVSFEHLLSGTIKSQVYVPFFSAISHRTDHFSTDPQFLLLTNSLEKPRSGYQVCPLLLDYYCFRLSEQIKVGNKCVYTDTGTQTTHLYLFCVHP